jgi:hypothetical protein
VVFFQRWLFFQRKRKNKAKKGRPLTHLVTAFRIEANSLEHVFKLLPFFAELL